MTNTEMLERKIEEKGITVEEIAEATGLSNSELLRKMKAEREFLVSEIWTISEMLALDSDEVQKIFFGNVVECGATKNDF